jgi:beta-lactamase class A
VSVVLPLELSEDPRLTDHITESLDAVALRPIAYAMVVDVRGRRFGAWRKDENVYPASVIKVPIMAEAFRRYEAGELSPDAAVTVTASNQTTTWGGETPFAAGTRTTVQALVERMITHSDNVATNQLMDVLGRTRVTDYMRSLGLPTFLLGRKLSGSDPLIEDPDMVGRNRLPPAEIATLLTLLAADRLPNAARQREILRSCLHDEKLAAGLHAGDLFAHKTGETSEQSHDAGILDTADGKRFVVVLYTTPEPSVDHADADHVNAQMTAWMRTVRESL